MKQPEIFWKFEKERSTRYSGNLSGVRKEALDNYSGNLEGACSRAGGASGPIAVEGGWKKILSTHNNPEHSNHICTKCFQSLPDSGHDNFQSLPKSNKVCEI